MGFQSGEPSPLLSFSLVLWWLGMNGQAGVGEEGPRELLAGADSVDAAFGCVSDVGEVVAGEVGQLAGLDGRPQQFDRVEFVRRPAAARG